jgi:hypothetical protein
MKLKTNTAPPLTANRLLYAVLHSLLIVLIVIIGTIKRKGLKRKERFGLPIIALNAVVNQRVGFHSIADNVPAALRGCDLKT